MDGAGGRDTAVYNRDAVSDVVLSLLTGIATGTWNGAFTYNISNVENVVGSNGGNDKITGNGVANELSGEDGQDTLNGGDGDDTLLGGFGKDSLVGGANSDTLNGGDNNDTLTGGAANDTFVFTDGWDHDVLTDFSSHDAEDIDLSGVGSITDFTDLVANHIRDNGGSAEIYHGSGNSILLQGVTVAQIGVGLDYSESDFVF